MNNKISEIKIKGMPKKIIKIDKDKLFEEELANYLRELLNKKEKKK